MSTTFLVLFIIAIFIILILAYQLKKKINKLDFVYSTSLGRGYSRKYRRWPVPRKETYEIDPALKENKFGITECGDISLHYGCSIPGGLGMEETWILSLLAKSAKNIFEIGTCTGLTTYHLAKNSPEDAKVTTITLSPEHFKDVSNDASDDKEAIEAAYRESENLSFVYENTDVAHKVTQLFGDSKKFDETPYEAQFDLIFIDGSHVYSYVKSDTEKAMKMLKPGGIIIWDDYSGPFITPGVFKYLNELSKELPLALFKRTRIVYYKKPI